MATTRDLYIPAGQTVDFTIDVEGGPGDLTDYAGAMMIRGLRTDPQPFAVVPPSAITVNPLNRQVTVKIPGDETKTYATHARGVYDLVITGPSGDTWRLIEGRVEILQAVTRED